METSSMTREFWIGFVASMLRGVLFSAGVFLETHGWISHDYAVGLTAPDLMQYLAGLILIGGMTLWEYRLQWFHVVFLRAAHQADSSVPLATVKNDVLTNSTSGTSSV